MAGLFENPPAVPSAKPPRPWLRVLILCSVCVFFCCPLLAAILLPVFSRAGTAASQILGRSNMTQLATAATMYCGDNDDHFPPAMDSGKSVRPYLTKYVSDKGMSDVFKSIHSGVILGDPRLASVKLSSISDPAIVLSFYDTVAWRPNKFLMGYADGHATITGRKRPADYLNQPIQMVGPIKSL